MKTKLTILILTSFFFNLASAQNTDKPAEVIEKKEEEKPKKWYESFAIRGYLQIRYNQLLETNEDLVCEQCDKSWGGDNGFFIRRARIIFSGQLNEHVYMYVQPDFASSAGTTNYITQLRDAYFDVSIDKKKEFRFRIGQSKVPFGFENMQSSQNRLPLDRNDALNSAVSNERDLGVFFYWAPEKVRKLYSSLVNDGLKGSGDYGVLGIGAYNGQTANQTETNGEPHIVGRLTYPFSLGNQIIEPGFQFYTGKYKVSNISSGVGISTSKNYLDQRMAGTLVLYPKPFGIQAEYNIGKGPEFNKETDSIEVQDLTGGYVTFSYLAKINKQILIPFFRMQYYDGGKKHELDARSYKVNEYEIGVEWQPWKNFELVAMYTISKRRFEDFIKQDNYQQGNVLRLQAQLNF
jgi:hypothetical protein